MVDVIADTLKRIEAAGGRIPTPRTEIGAGMGAFAVFADPVGNEFESLTRNLARNTRRVLPSARESRDWYWRHLLQGQRPEGHAGLGTNNISVSTCNRGEAPPSTGLAPMASPWEERQPGASRPPRATPSRRAKLLHGELPGRRRPRFAQALRDEGCNVLDKFDDSEYGKFGWVIDPEGNKVELWGAASRTVASTGMTTYSISSSAGRGR